jgi:hypothetical protein
VSIIDSSSNKVVDTISLPQSARPLFIAFNPTNNYMYVTDNSLSAVSVISTTTSVQGIQKLINIIDSFNLPTGVTNSLEAPLNAAINQLNHNNNVAACNQLNAFLNQVSAKQTNGQLTLQQAADLRQQATAIQHAIGCSSVGGMAGSSSSPSLLPLPMPWMP